MAPLFSSSDLYVYKHIAFRYLPEHVFSLILLSKLESISCKMLLILKTLLPPPFEVAHSH